MAIWGAFTTSSQAMMAHSHHLNHIGTNIANVNTTSFKETISHYQTMKSNVSGNFNFFGVQNNDWRRVDSQGMILPSSYRHDLAVNGQGFFVVNSDPSGLGETRYTRDGSFQAEAMGTASGIQGSYMTTRDGFYVMGWPANDDGTFTQALEAVSYNHNAIEPTRPTTQIELAGNLTSANGSTASHTTTLYAVTETADGVGMGNNLRLVWTPIPDEQNAWTVSIADDGSGISLDPTEVRFTGDGQLADGSPAQLTLAGGITLDISNVTQFSSGEGFTVRYQEHDGTLAGRLQDTYFNNEGVLFGRFSNGSTRALYKLPLAVFPAPNKLEALNGNTYRPTHESGLPELREAGAMYGFAQIVPGALEQSTVNIEDQFTKMITTQKAYSLSATVFRTADEMTQEATKNLKR